MCQRSLYYLCKEVLGYEDFVPHVHGDLCDFAIEPKFGRFRQATMPRSWFKTWTWTIGKSIWLTLPDEEGLYKDIFPYKGANVRVLIASNVIDNAAKMVFKIKQEWMNNERLKAAFPELLPDFNKTRWSDHVAQVKRTINATEGTYTAVGVGGSVISQHFDHIMEDDLIYARKDDFTGQELMPSQEDIDNAIGWHKLAFSLLANPQTGCIDCIGTRWAPQDIIYYLQKYEKQYKIMHIASTVNGMWPIKDDSECIWPERYNKETLEAIEATQGARMFECFPEETPILLPDWTCSPIKDIKVGDIVVGFSNGTVEDKSHLLKSKVTLVEKHVKEVVKITLDNGKVIRCTSDHPWYTGRKDKSHKPYLPAVVGRDLLEICDCIKNVTSEDLSDYRYLAGIIDGEGACNFGSIAIGQSKEANPDVYYAIRDVLERLRIPYKMATCNPNETHIVKGKVVARGTGETFVLGGGRQVKGDIIRLGQPAKAHRILDTIWKHPYMPIKGTTEVVSIEPDGRETVYAIGTESGNYVAWGYATKNTQYLNRPRATADIVFRKECVQIHEHLQEFPVNEYDESGHSKFYKTIVDLAGWGDSKGLANNVVLTGGLDRKHHLWVARLDVGRYNPTEVIDKFREHSKQFKSVVHIEEIQYQRAVQHFAREKMEASGDFYNIQRLPYDGRKNAKELRIVNIEPLVSNGGLHILAYMQLLLDELEFYPNSRTRDILDCLGYLVRIARAADIEPRPKEHNKFSMETIERELKERSSSIGSYPFELQLDSRGNEGYGR